MKTKQTTLPKPDLRKSDDLFKTFGKIHNFIYANDGLPKHQALDELIKLLFLKFLDESKSNDSFYIDADEYAEIQKTGNNKDFSSRTETLFKEVKNKYPNLFDSNEKINLKLSSVSYIVNSLQNLSLVKSSNDVKGLAFQKFLSSSQKKDRGQYFTPEPVIRLTVEILQPKLEENIIDPACGTGGFLTAAINYLKRKSSIKDLNTYINNNVWGIEIALPIARLAKMRLILTGAEGSNIINTDSLQSWNSLNMYINKIRKERKDYKGYFDILLTNPPFGTQGKIVNQDLLLEYELGFKWQRINSEVVRSNDALSGQVPEVLFLERCLQFLKDGGRMAIVLPNGEFENPTYDYLRKFIKSQGDIEAVVKLPQETFIPFGTGVKTSVLFMRKGSNSNKRIFFGNITKIGYLGNKNITSQYVMDKQGKVLRNDEGEPIIDEDVTNVVKDFLSFRKTGKVDSKVNYRLNINEIKDRIDYEYYHPSYTLLQKKLIERGAKKLGDIAEIVRSRSNKLKKKDSLVSYIELSNINIDYMEISGVTEMEVYKLPSRATYEVKEGDIITAVAGNAIGTENHTTALVTDKFDGFICTNGFRILRNTKVDKYYLLYFLSTPLFKKQIFRERTGAAIPSISEEGLRNIFIYIPKIEIIKKISKKVKESYELRKESRLLMSDITVSI